AGARGGGRYPAHHGRHPDEVLARHQRDLSLGRRRVRGAAGGDDQGWRAARVRPGTPEYPFAHGRRITASFGIAALPEDVTPTADSMLQAADEALYAAKRAGKNRVRAFEDITTVPRAEPEVERVG